MADLVDAPRLWYVIWWSAWTVGAALVAHVVVVRPITRRLDAVLAAVDRG